MWWIVAFKDDVDYIRLLQIQISLTEDLKRLFVLLIRNYNPTTQSRQYLQDLIVTNHILLLIPDGISQAPDPVGHTNLMEHINQYERLHSIYDYSPRKTKLELRRIFIPYRFATVEIMQQYGLLLENFNENSEYVNDCILTMMHHIAGNHVTMLFQPIILKTYSRIWEADYELCDVSHLHEQIEIEIKTIVLFHIFVQYWRDLIEHVIHKCLKTSQQGPLMAASPTLHAARNSNHGSGEGFW